MALPCAVSPTGQHSCNHTSACRCCACSLPHRQAGPTVPLLGQLMHAAPHVTPTESHSLLATLEILAEAHGQPSLSAESKQTISSMMNTWGFSLKQNCGPVTLWSSCTIHSGKDHVLMSSQLLNKGLTSFCDLSPSAALQLPDATAGSPFDTVELDPLYLVGMHPYLSK